jgi:hypothetical protein
LESKDVEDHKLGLDIDEGGEVGPPRPSKNYVENQEEEAAAGPPRPTLGNEDEDDDDGNDEYTADQRDEEEETDPWLLPITHELALTGHTRAVTALDVEHSGSRVVTGGLDYMIRIYDFNGMKSDMKPFR